MRAPAAADDRPERSRPKAQAPMIRSRGQQAGQAPDRAARSTRREWPAVRGPLYIESRPAVVVRVRALIVLQTASRRGGQMALVASRSAAPAGTPGCGAGHRTEPEGISQGLRHTGRRARPIRAGRHQLACGAGRAQARQRDLPRWISIGRARAPSRSRLGSGGTLDLASARLPPCRLAIATTTPGRRT